jgi:large subunit ribosomal protein L22
MKSSLTNYRQSPRKVRLVADLVKGKSVKNALAELDLLGTRASLPVKKLIQSAVANAKENNKVDADRLIVKELRVDKGVVLKRFMPRARGSAFGIKKRSSHIHVVLAEGVPVENKKKAVKKAAVKKVAQKAEAKK